jgi:TRAP transporter TAXI family solute receptor
MESQMPNAPNRRRALALLAATLLCGVTSGAGAETFLSVGTGSPSGLYYPIGRALCAVIDRGRRDHGVRCSAEPTVGSIYNVDALRTGDLDLALVQSDVQFNAYSGRADWADSPDTELRSILSLHPELVTILARGESGVHRVEELKGKRIDIGKVGSGARATWAGIEAALGWSETDLALVTSLSPDSAGAALCADEIDASVQLVGHPSARVAAGFGQCDLDLVSVTGPAIAELVVGRPFYRPGEIPAAMYGSHPATPTFGVSATLVATADLPDDMAYAIARTLLEGVDELRSRNAVLGALEPGEMIRIGLTAPLHPGAERAYRDLGLIK